MYNVLIVDDEPMILSGLESIIDWAEYGLEIAGLASNAMEAQEIILTKKIDILLTDIKMPKMGGLELIECIRQKKLNTRIIILSGYDDFNYIKKAIKLGVENYLLKPVNKEELSLTLLNTIEKLQSEFQKEIIDIESKDVFKQNLLFRWVTDHISAEELAERASMIGIDLKASDYMVATMNIIDRSDNTKDNIAGNAVFQICSEWMTKEGSPFLFNDLDFNIIMLFFDHDIVSKKTAILNYLKKCIDNINTLLKINVFTTLGSIEHDYQTVCKSYFSSIRLQEYSLISAPNSILDYDDFAQYINNQKEINIDIELEKLNEYIVHKQKDKAFLLINNLYHKLLSLDGTSPEDVQNFTIEFLYNISNIYKKSVHYKKNLHDLEIKFLDITKLKTSDELIDYVKIELSKTIDCLSVYEKNQNPLIRYIVDYINSNYQEAISLKSISHKFCANASYLGQLFKCETGDLFSNYLNKVRIQKAEEMLVQTNFKIYDISNKVGYVNQSLFFRTFKKLTGISPEEYRDKYKMLQ